MAWIFFIYELKERHWKMNPRNLVHVSQNENYCLHSIVSNCVQMINANANKILTVILKGKLTLESPVRFTPGWLGFRDLASSLWCSCKRVAK